MEYNFTCARHMVHDAPFLFYLNYSLKIKYKLKIYFYENQNLLFDIVLRLITLDKASWDRNKSWENPIPFKWANRGLRFWLWEDVSQLRERCHH